MEASIVIPTHNRISLLLQTLHCFNRQTHPQDQFEIIVIDDGSEDGTAQLLQEFKPSFNFRWLSHLENKGRAAARNSGIRMAKGGLIIFLDSDMTVLPNFVEKHIHYHNQEENRVVIGNVKTSLELKSSALSRYIDTRGVHKLKKGEPPPFRYFVASNSSCSRELLFLAGLFDEEIRDYGGEELELAYRLIQNGGKFIYAEDIISYHHHFYQISEVRRKVRTFGEKSLPFILSKHPQLKEILGVNLIESGIWELCSLKLLLLKFLLSTLGERGGKILSILLSRWESPFPFSSYFFDYLLLSEKLEGYREYLRRLRG